MPRIKNSRRDTLRRTLDSEKKSFKSKRQLREHITGTTSRTSDPFSKKTKAGQKRRGKLAKWVTKVKKVKGATPKYNAGVHRVNVRDFAKKKVK
jgi:hypothetical protein